MKNGLRIVDADCHQVEPPDMWPRYLDPEFADRAPGVATIGGKELWGVEGESFTSEGEENDGKYQFSSPEFTKAFLKQRDKKFKRAHEAGYTPESRLLDMDEAGVDVQIIYPTVAGMMLGRVWQDPALLDACVRAYNNWTREYCQADPKRLRWSAVIHLQDPAVAVKEIQRTAELGAVSFFTRANPVLGRNLYHEDYYPVWEAVQASGLAVSLHDAASPRLPSFGARMDSHTTGHILSHPFEAMAAMVGLIWFGIFERFPDLRVVHVEADAGWVPYWLQRMEQHYDFSGNAEHPDLKMSPTEYFQRNMWVAARGDEPTLPAAVDLVGEDKFLFNTDYPHADGTFPVGIDALLAQPISDDAKRKILWDNSEAAFKVEL